MTINRIQFFVYLIYAKINKHFMEGNFTEGLDGSIILKKLKEYELLLTGIVFWYFIIKLPHFILAVGKMKRQ